MHHIISIQLIVLLFISWFLFIPCNTTEGTTYPIPEELKQAHFCNDDLADKLSAELKILKTKFQALEERGNKLKGMNKLTPFTYAKYVVRYTPEQIEKFQADGWIKTKKFG